MAITTEIAPRSIKGLLSLSPEERLELALGMKLFTKRSKRYKAFAGSNPETQAGALMMALHKHDELEHGSVSGKVSSSMKAEDTRRMRGKICVEVEGAYTDGTRRHMIETFDFDVPASRLKEYLKKNSIKAVASVCVRMGIADGE